MVYFSWISVLVRGIYDFFLWVSVFGSGVNMFVFFLQTFIRLGNQNLMMFLSFSYLNKAVSNSMGREVVFEVTFSPSSLIQYFIFCSQELEKSSSAVTLTTGLINKVTRSSPSPIDVESLTQTWKKESGNQWPYCSTDNTK